MSALQLYLRSNLIWKINKIFSVKASVVTYECKRIRKKKLFIQANSKVTLHIWSWAWVVFGQSTPLYFKPFLGDSHLTFDGGMGYFRKKMQTDFEGGKSCKEIPGEEISCTETKKYLSWCIMLEKKILYTIIPRGKNSITRGLGKNSYPATYKSPISHLKSKMVNPFLSFLSSHKILSLPFLLSARNFLKIHNEWSQIHFKFAYFSFFLTALFTNKRTLKLESHLHNCIFLCRQSKNTETHKTDRNSPIKHKPWPVEPECLL